MENAHSQRSQSLCGVPVIILLPPKLSLGFSSAVCQCGYGRQKYMLSVEQLEFLVERRFYDVLLC